MKKHVIGFTLFSIIVGTAAFIYAMFNVVKVEEVFAPAYTPTYQRNSCWKMKRNLKESEVNLPTITQAIFNLKTRKFSWNLSTIETDSPIVLHFFVNDGKGTRYIDSVSAKSLVRDGNLNFSPSYMKLGKLDSQANFYFIAEVNGALPNYFHEKKISPQVKFDASKAVAVTIDYGE